MMLFALIAALQASAPIESAPAPAVAAPAIGDKPICKRYPVAGSNIPGKKQCLTRAQWDQMARQAQQFKRGTEQALTTRNQ